jgi:hypothetical protein
MTIFISCALGGFIFWCTVLALLSSTAGTTTLGDIALRLEALRDELGRHPSGARTNGFEPKVSRDSVILQSFAYIDRNKTNAMTKFDLVHTRELSEGTSSASNEFEFDCATTFLKQDHRRQGESEC